MEPLKASIYTAQRFRESILIQKEEEHGRIYRYIQ